MESPTSTKTLEECFHTLVTFQHPGTSCGCSWTHSVQLWNSSMPHTWLVALIDFNHDRKTLASHRLSRLWLLSSARHPALGCRSCEASLMAVPGDAIQLFPSNYAFLPYICDTTGVHYFFWYWDCFCCLLFLVREEMDTSPFREMEFSLVIYTF